MSDLVLKILTLGESTVGKTSIIMRYTDNTFSQQFLSTVGIDFKAKIIDYKDKKIKVLLVDTSGQVRFRNIAANYYKSADGILFVYDITSKDSLAKFDYWLSQIKQSSNISSDAIFLFGNKNDMVNERQITLEEGKAKADEYKLHFFEGSAQSGENINECIHTLIDKIMETKKFLDDESNTTIKLDLIKSDSNKAKENKKDYSHNATCCG